MFQKIKNQWSKQKNANKILTIFSAFLIIFSIFLGTTIRISFADTIPDKLTTTRKDFETPTLSLFNGIVLSGMFRSAGKGHRGTRSVGALPSG